MGKIRVISLESTLEVDKLHEKELAANKSGEYDALYNNVQEMNKVEEVKESEKEPTEDASEETSTEEPDASMVESDASVESFRESFGKLEYSAEDFQSSLASVADLAGSLGVLGITYGGKALKSLFKGVVYIFAKLGKLLYDGTNFLVKYLNRRINSFSNLKKSIASLKQTLNAIESKDEVSDLTDLKYTNVQSINSLKIGDSVDFTANIKKLSQFVDTTVKSISNQIYHENGAINHIMSSGRMNSAKLPTGIMKVNPTEFGLREGNVQGYENNSEYITPYHSPTILPSDVVLVATMPRDDLSDIEDVIKGYNNSALFLGFDISSFRKVDAVDYMNNQELSGFLDSLDALCDICIAHQAIYEKIKHSKLYMRTSLKNYFLSLANMENKTTIKSSFMEYIYVKSAFTDKVYLTAMIDIHDYVGKVLTVGTRFVKNNIEQLS